MMRIVSCKCTIFLSLVAMVAIDPRSTAAMATGTFSNVNATPTPAAQGTQVTITFTASQWSQYHPTVTVNTHSASFVGQYGSAMSTTIPYSHRIRTGWPQS